MFARILLLATILSIIISANAQRLPDVTYSTAIKSIKFSKFGDQIAYPIIRLNSVDQLELHFDDLDGGVKNYYYTFVLCNADWTPAQLSQFDYLKGYSQVRISTYRNSSIALKKYTHYQTTLPDRNAVPTKSGNYLLKVFLNGDTSKLSFTRRFLVVDEKISLSTQLLLPSNQQFFQTHHRLQIMLDTKNLGIQYPQQQIKINVLQNYRWDNLLKIGGPTFVKQDMLQYSNENEMIMPAGKEFRWLNLRSFRLLGDRIKRQENSDSAFALFVKEDQPRLPRQYFYYRDLNGRYMLETTEQINPFWNADYAEINFSFRPPHGQPYGNADLIIMGELTNYGKDPDALMQFNADKGSYVGSLFLKQGYYDYQYVLRTVQNGRQIYQSTYTEQDTWETENNYLVLVYFRSLGGRYDELIGIRQFNSQFNKEFR
jgi:hypothetical protein